MALLSSSVLTVAVFHPIGNVIVTMIVEIILMNKIVVSNTTSF